MSADPGEISIFGQLLELGDGEREAELAILEAKDNALATRLRRLLFAHSSPLLEQTPLQPADSLPEETPGEIGGYRVVSRLGQGGMGNVWLCEQTSPVKRLLAIKVLRAGMDTREVLARFDAERQALALMSHPNIARIIDAGTTPAGRPFFAMEYVPGTPLVRYCNEHSLDLRQRLQLFMQVCAAVQHAHHKGIIHRDIKPSNILVVHQDGSATARIIDFGIAKALGAQLTGKTLHTLNGNLVGTPEYMSPEQADIGAVDVDTRADVYSLGVVLFELLTGCVPFSFSKQVISLGSIQRTLRTAEAPLASRKLSDSQDAATQAAQCGLPDSASLIASLRGDLDWIVLKALQKDRGRRYESASEFAADIDRYLEHKPVNAARPNALYLFRKFIRRNSIAVVGAALLSSLLVCATAFAAFQAGQLRIERDRARLEAAKAEQVREFLVGLFASDAPDVNRRPDVTVREVLDYGAERAHSGLEQQGETRAALLHAIGRVYIALGLNAEAERTFATALADEAADRNPLLDRSLRVELARVVLEQDRLKDAENILDSLLAENAGNSNLDDTAALRSQLYLGELYLRTNRVKQAETLFRNIIRESNIHDTEQLKTNALAQLLLGRFLFESSRLDEAQQLLDRAIPLLTETLGAANITVLQGRGLYAALLAIRGDLDTARLYVTATRETAERTYGTDHPATAMAYGDVGFLYTQEKNYAAAEEYLLRALATYQATLGEMHSRTALILNNLGAVYHNTGRLDEGLQTYSRVLEIYRELMGNSSAEAASVEQNIGFLLVAMNRAAEAEPYFRNALAVLIDTYSADHWLVANVRYGLGSALLAQQRYPEAEVELCAAPSVLSHALGASHYRTVRAEEGIRQLYASWQERDASMTGRKCP